MTDQSVKQNLSTATPSKAKSSVDANRTNKDVKTRTSKKMQIAKPLFPPTPASPLSQFKSATGTALGNREVIIEFDDFGDAVGTGWNCLGYAFETLPGAGGQSIDVLSQTINLRSAEVSVLPPAMTSNTATNNVMVLAGVSMRGEGGNAIRSLCGGTQTFIQPSNVPEWKRVLMIDFLTLKRSNFDNVTDNIWTEIARIALVNPDNGAFSTATSLQVRVRVRYSIGLALTNEVSTSVSIVPNPDSLPSFQEDGGDQQIVFPRVVGLSNTA